MADEPVRLSDGATNDRYGRFWPVDTEVCDLCGQPDNTGDCTHDRLAEDEVTELGGNFSAIIESPSGWSFRNNQENGDQVDCWNCGNPLDDDYPIVNDEQGYAYHEGCLPKEDS